MISIAISYTEAAFEVVAQQAAQELNLPLILDSQNLLDQPPSFQSDSSVDQAREQFVLHFGSKGLTLMCPESNGFTSVRCDFTSGANRHRMHHGGGNGQAIAKAVGISGKFAPLVLDLTAGMAADAFVLATLGCQIRLLERHPIVYKLLEDGLSRAAVEAETDPQLAAILDRINLVKIDSGCYLDALEQSDCPDVIYIDPMFPPRKKSAKVKKTMQAFHKLVGSDDDSAGLLEKSLAKARYRVVVKRPSHADFLACAKPSYSLKGKSTRFDIYTLKKLPG
ncbi:MAG: class I SAM-dependent methyltransferase [Porticoccaceae bacterium]